MFLRFGRLFFFGLLVAGAARAADPAAQARELFQRGQQALAQGKAQEAIDIFDQAYRAGNSPSLLFYLGEAYRQKGENAKAIAEYKLYLEKMPTGPKRADAEARVAELEKQGAVGPALTPQGAPVAKRKMQVDALDLEEVPKPAAPPQKMVAEDLDLSLTAPPPAAAPAAEKTDKHRRRDRKAREKEAAEEAALAAAAAHPPAPVPASPSLELPPSPPPPKPVVVERKDPPLPLLGPIPQASEAKPVPPPPAVETPLPKPPPTIVAVAPTPPPPPVTKTLELTPLSPGSAEAPYAKVNPPAPIELSPLPEHRSEGGGQRTAGVVVGVIGLAALATGGAFGLGALNAANDLTADAQNGRQYNPSTQSRGERDQHLEIGFIAGGGAMVVTGILLFSLVPSSEEASASSEKSSSVSFGYASIAPVPGGAAASAGLRF